MVPALPWILAAYALLSLTAAGAYALDKRRARRRAPRLRERNLHLLALAGGWPGALWARRRLRHKTRKRLFGAVLALAAALHGLLWVWLLLRQGG